MIDNENVRQYNLLYRKTHRVAIRIKNRIYKRLPHVRERTRRQRRDYFKRYYQGHRRKLIDRACMWGKVHRDKRRIYCRRYKEKLKKKQNGRMANLERVINEFLEYYRERYDHETIRHYRINLGRFMEYVNNHSTKCPDYHARRYQEFRKPIEEQDFGWTKEYYRIRFVEEMDRDYIARYVKYVNNDAVSLRSGCLLSQSEKESRLYPLKTFLNYCIRKGYLKDDLRKFIYVPSREKKIQNRALSPEEMARLLEVPNTNKTLGIRDRALLELSYSGLRADELLSLKLNHVDVDTNTVTIICGKGNKDRVIPMTKEAIYWIKRWLPRRAEIIKNRNDDGHIFITKGNRSVLRRSFAKMLKRYVRKAGIPIDVAPHDLRRATATHLAENGAPVRQIQALLGHATLKVTTKYLRLSDEHIKKEHRRSHPSNRRCIHYGRPQE